MIKLLKLNENFKIHSFNTTIIEYFDFLIYILYYIKKFVDFNSHLSLFICFYYAYGIIDNQADHIWYLSSILIILFL